MTWRRALEAARKGDASGVADTLRAGSLRPDVACHEKSGDCLLHVIAGTPGAHVVLASVEAILADVNWQCRNFEFKTPLHEASQKKNVEAVAFLLSKGVDVDALKRSDWTPLMLACTKEGNLEVIRALVETGADVSLSNKDGWTPFHLASREGDVMAMEFLLHCDSDLWRTKSKTGRTPLHTAALAGRAEAVLWLLRRGQYEKDEKDSCGTTPLMDAIRANSEETVRLLLAAGHDPKVRDLMDRNCLHVAAHAGRKDVVQLLVKEAGMIVDEASQNGMRALHWAALEGQHEAVEELLELGADFQALDGKGRTVFAVAGQSGHRALSEFLSRWSSSCRN